MEHFLIVAGLMVASFIGGAVCMKLFGPKVQGDFKVFADDVKGRVFALESKVKDDIEKRVQALEARINQTLAK